MKAVSEALPLYSIQTANKSTLNKMLKVALREEHIWPAFQPVVDIRTGKLASFEVLARWGNAMDG